MWLVTSYVSPTGDLAYNPGMCPDWELNRQPFGSQSGAQSTEVHQPGQLVLRVIYKDFLISKCNVKEFCLVSKKMCFYEYKFLNKHIVAKYFQKPIFELIYLQGFKHCFHCLSGGRLTCYFQETFGFPPTNQPRRVGVQLRAIETTFFLFLLLVPKEDEE